MGEVFRATDEQLGREVALKLLLPSADEHAGERFHREARAAARLSDPHVVSVYDFGPHGDGHFLVMELVEGGTVATELAEYGPLPKERAIRIVEQAAAGLAAAHREDVVHRDVKPGNLLLTADGTVKVADFGIAHLPGDGASTLTATGQIIGSTHYLAPERAQRRPGRQAVGRVRAGLCALSSWSPAQPPFTAEHPAAILYQHVDAAAEHRRVCSRPELAGAFESVLLRMLAKDPAESIRPQPNSRPARCARNRPETTPASYQSFRQSPPLPPLQSALLRCRPTRSSRSPARWSLPIVARVSRAEASRSEADRARNKALAAGVVAVLAIAAATFAVILLNGREPNLLRRPRYDPPAGATSSSTPNPGATSTAPTQSGTTSRTNPTTSAPPSPSASSQPTTPTTSPSTTSPRTTSPTTAPTTTTSSRPTQPSTTPTASTSPPTSTTAPPSTTPPPQTSPPTTPATATPAAATPPPATPPSPATD